MKTNPRKKPASQEDVRRAQTKAVNDAVRMTSAIFLTVLCDKFCGADYIPDVWREVSKLSEEIKEKRVSVPDLIREWLMGYPIWWTELNASETQ